MLDVTVHVTLGGTVRGYPALGLDQPPVLVADAGGLFGPWP